jgi:virulence surface antigen
MAHWERQHVPVGGHRQKHGPVEVGTHRQAPASPPPRPSKFRGPVQAGTHRQGPKPSPSPVLSYSIDAPPTSIDPEPVVLRLDPQDLAPFRMGKEHQYGALKRLPFVRKMFKFKQEDRLFELAGDVSTYPAVATALMECGFGMDKIRQSVAEGICLTLSMRWIAEQLQLSPSADRLSSITLKGMAESLFKDVTARHDEAALPIVAMLAAAHGLHYDGNEREFLVDIHSMNQVLADVSNGYFVFGWTGIGGHATAYTDQGGMAKFFDPNAGEYLLTTSQRSNKATFLDKWHECARKPYFKVKVYQVWAA